MGWVGGASCEEPVCLHHHCQKATTAVLQCLPSPDSSPELRWTVCHAPLLSPERNKRENSSVREQISIVWGLISPLSNSQLSPLCPAHPVCPVLVCGSSRRPRCPRPTPSPPSPRQTGTCSCETTTAWSAPVASSPGKGPAGETDPH